MNNDISAPKRDVHNLMFPPDRAVRATMAEVNRRSSLVSELNWGIPEIDQHVNPLLPGDVMILLGRPGMGKTISAIYLSKYWANNVRKNIVGGKPQVVVYFTVETMVEQFMMVYTTAESGQSLASIGRGTADNGRVQTALVNTIGKNFIIVGKSQELEGSEASLHPSMYDLGNVLKELRDQGFSVASVIVDYIQFVGDRNNHFPAGDKRMGIIEDNLAMTKTLGLEHKTSFVVCAQAGRQVDEYGGVKFPRLDDGQWTSLLEQAGDKIFSVTLPGKYMEEGQRVKVNGIEYAIQPDTLGLKMLKQRFGACNSSHVWFINANLAAATMEIQQPAGEDIEY